jgi:hypothetical protein
MVLPGNALGVLRIGRPDNSRQRYLGLAHTYLSSGYCEKFALLVHRLLPERNTRHTVFSLSWAIPAAAGVAKN